MPDRRVAVVTGANKGIGLEIARQLAREGITVCLGARDGARGPAAAEKLRAEGLDARWLRLDVTDDRSVSAAVAALEKDADRIVNLSSGLGALALNSDPRWAFAPVEYLAYDSSKTAVNAITVQFAHELRETPIKVNAADPGYVATDMNRHQGVRSVEQGAATPVRLATLPADGPTGGYFDDDGPVPW